MTDIAVQSVPELKRDSQLTRAFKDIIAGTAGGIGLTLVGHPMDSMKVRLQTDSHVNPRYKGLGDCMSQTYKGEGMSGFYKGVASPLVGQMFLNAVQFVVYTEAKRYVAGSEEASKNMTIPQLFAAGTITGAAVALIEGPVDLMKTQLQTQIFSTQPAKFKTLGETVSYVYGIGGIRGIGQGLGATMARNCPAVACYFGFYELARQQIAKAKNITLDELSTGDLMVSGAVGGCFYWVFTYPIDCIKSAMMADAIPRGERQYPTMAVAARKLWAQGGMKRFYKGITPCLLRAVPANAVCFTLYEMTVRQLNKVM